MKKQLLAVVFLGMHSILLAASYDVPPHRYQEQPAFPSSSSSSSSSSFEQSNAQQEPLVLNDASLPSTTFPAQNVNNINSFDFTNLVFNYKKKIEVLEQKIVEKNKEIEKLHAKELLVSSSDSEGNKETEDEKNALQGEKDVLEVEKNALASQKKFWVNTTFAGTIFIATYAAVKYLRRKYIKKTDWLNKKSKEQLMLEKVKPLPAALVASAIFMIGALII